MKLAELGEFGLIDRIRRRAGAAPGVLIGIGDDCAAVELPGELLLTSTDLLIEEVHFRRAWTTPHLLGRKSVAVNVSDIAAMGGTPRQLYLGLGVPPAMAVEEIEALLAGVLEAAGEYGAALVGGDTCRSPGPLLIAVTASGSVPAGEMIRREGARPGDGLYVSGTLGDAALALRQLQAGETPEPFLAGRHHDPQARTRLGRALATAGIPSAMIDLSDGLLADLGHILEASGVGAEVEEETLPLSPALARALATDPSLLELALGGGEDYELLFTVPAGREEALAAAAAAATTPVSRVGRIVAPEQGLTLRDRLGRQQPLGQRGFNHFAAEG